MGLPKIAVPEYSLILPSTGEEIKYRPFLVKEEKILLMAMESDDEKQITDATKAVIRNCVFGDINIETLPMFDIEFIFLWLRGRSKGEEIELKYSCPTCKGEIPIFFNIEDVNVHKTNDHTNRIQITDDLGICLKYPDMKLQEKINSINSDQEVEVIFETILLSIDYLYDNEKTYPAKDHTTAEMEEFLESLSDDQFQKIAKFFETMPKLKHDVVLECKNKVKGEGKKKDKVCGYKEDMTLEGLQSFFA